MNQLLADALSYHINDDFNINYKFLALSKLTIKIYKKLLFTTLKNRLVILASRDGYLAIVEYLHQHGADITAQDNLPICWASRNGHLAVVEYLHQHGAAIASQDNLPIRWASDNGHLAVVQYLHQHGAGITSHNNLSFR